MYLSSPETIDSGFIDLDRSYGAGNPNIGTCTYRVNLLQELIALARSKPVPEGSRLSQLLFLLFLVHETTPD